MVSAEQDVTGVLLEGRYRIDELLAVGGMSRVYRGTDTRLDRAVAVKVMDARLAADPSFRGRFEREARAIARLDHPGVIGVFDQGEHGDGPQPLVFLVMELVTGGTLRDVLTERGPLPLPEAFAVLEPVLSALAAAHAEGLTHRDVKPENVLISHGGAVKVADFGLVTAAAQARASTAGVILGTVAYLSPEQVNGRTVDARSDVYAAGVLLYELLTGMPPYDGDHPLAVAYRHVNEDVPPPSELMPALHPDVDTLVATATRRDPDGRPRDAETLLHAVRGVRVALGIPKVPVPVPRAGAGRHAAPPAAARAPDPDEATVPVPVPAGGGAHHSPPRPTRALTSMVPTDEAGWPGGEPGEAGGTAWTAGSGGDPAADHRRMRQRSRRILAIWIAAVLLLGILVATLAWGAGANQWTAAPTVAGLDRASAERLVTEAELVPAWREAPDDGIPAGRVVGSDPPAAAQVRKGSTVTLTVSLGRPQVPLIRPGTSVPEAEGAIRAANLVPKQLDSARRAHPTALAGTVVDTLPPAGTALASGSPVTLVISSGPPKRTPNRERGDEWSDEFERRLSDGLSDILGFPN